MPTWKASRTTCGATAGRLKNPTQKMLEKRGVYLAVLRAIGDVKFRDPDLLQIAELTHMKLGEKVHSDGIVQEFTGSTRDPYLEAGLEKANALEAHAMIRTLRGRGFSIPEIGRHAGCELDLLWRIEAGSNDIRVPGTVLRALVNLNVTTRRKVVDISYKQVGETGS